MGSLPEESPIIGGPESPLIGGENGMGIWVWIFLMVSLALFVFLGRVALLKEFCLRDNLMAGAANVFVMMYRV